MKKSSLSGLTARTIGNPVYYFESLDSTNRWLKENGNLMPHGTLCWTGFQTSGRGRLGRKWCAAKGQSVALSLLIKPSNKAALLPLICGIAVCDALQLLTGKTFQIKWPNDIICEGYKICGVLCENCLSEDGGYAVAGIGINLDQTAEDFTKSGLPRAGSVRMVAGRAPAPELVVASVMNR
ncbi:MAG TPA: biotin--[acetyl-CoA-carboxylase] ligase, partial [Ruminococcaceae bacterium]|nr:biotin--[acetyl-CoA-carboxylase] ligase [Oscillospiraceae bacterium]